MWYETTAVFFFRYDQSLYVQERILDCIKYCEILNSFLHLLKSYLNRNFDALIYKDVAEVPLNILDFVLTINISKSTHWIIDSLRLYYHSHIWNPYFNLWHSGYYNG